ESYRSAKDTAAAAGSGGITRDRAARQSHRGGIDAAAISACGVAADRAARQSQRDGSNSAAAVIGDIAADGAISQIHRVGDDAAAETGRKIPAHRALVERQGAVAQGNAAPSPSRDVTADGGADQRDIPGAGLQCIGDAGPAPRSLVAADDTVNELQ